MLLKPLGPGAPIPPMVLEGHGVRASVSFLDGVPLLHASGPAAFRVRPAPRRFGRTAPERGLDATVPVTEALRPGDVLTLAIGSVEHAWTYVPDGNLHPVARTGMRLAREATFPLVAAAVVALVCQVNLGDTEAMGGGNRADDAIPRIIRRNASSVYPPNDTQPSDYLRAMLAAKREGRDLDQASREWVAAHGQPEAAKEGKAE